MIRSVIFYILSQFFVLFEFPQVRIQGIEEGIQGKMEGGKEGDRGRVRGRKKGGG
jgi:hypothetical protein